MESENVVNTQNVELKFKGLIINIERRKITRNGKKIELSPKEFELLVLMQQIPVKITVVQTC